MGWKNEMAFPQVKYLHVPMNDVLNHFVETKQKKAEWN